jgi:hypothetical protein
MSRKIGYTKRRKNNVSRRKNTNLRKIGYTKRRKNKISRRRNSKIKNKVSKRRNRLFKKGGSVWGTGTSQDSTLGTQEEVISSHKDMLEEADKLWVSGEKAKAEEIYREVLSRPLDEPRDETSQISHKEYSDIKKMEVKGLIRITKKPGRMPDFFGNPSYKHFEILRQNIKYQMLQDLNTNVQYFINLKDYCRNNRPMLELFEPYNFDIDLIIHKIETGKIDELVELAIKAKDLFPESAAKYGALLGTG